MSAVLRHLLGVLLLLPLSAPAQKSYALDAPPDAGCTLPPLTGGAVYHRPYVPVQGLRPKAAGGFAITFIPADSVVNGKTCAAWPPAAESAMQYAASIWTDVLKIEQAVQVDACYTDLGSGTSLASAGPASLVAWGNAAANDFVLYPRALFDQLVGTDSGVRDIDVFVNAQYAGQFYYGTDGAPPIDKFDFVTIMLHELGHGLGFSGQADVNDGDDTNGVECHNVPGDGCVGVRASIAGRQEKYHPLVYDLFTDRTSDGTRLIDLPANPGTEIAAALTGGGGGVVFDETNESNPNHTGTTTSLLYTPATFSRGSSYSHFDDPSELMSYAIGPGTALHDVGNAATVMYNLGYSAAPALPIQWISLTARPEGQGVRLRWEVADVTGAADFEVEASRGDEPFRRVGRVPAGEGRYSFLDDSPDYGYNLYRLRRVELDGRATYSPVVSVHHAGVTLGAGTVYPNPAATAGPAWLDFTAAVDGELHVSIVDMLGRTVRRARTGVRAGANRIALDVVGLSPGKYALRISGAGEVVGRPFLVQ
ncbi:T9SS type A sorting domain-containing protein [Lewinella sp. IMCC34183]|uniref:T9SS type A sorting domain-containing protein n=1 Tax=Lewinella sp. IMCC34183 TaxID=2248762 RepID=UPI000E25CC45|nr:T9SS type A sorting domain-containing protein [Lewinella sp. IMCC34183]